MTRRSLLTLIASLPFCGWMKPKARRPRLEDLGVRIYPVSNGKWSCTVTYHKLNGEVFQSTIPVDPSPIFDIPDEAIIEARKELGIIA